MNTHTTHPTAGSRAARSQATESTPGRRRANSPAGADQPLHSVAEEPWRPEMEFDPATLSRLRGKIGIGCDQIERCAYAIWEAEGRPEGKQAEHWRQAEVHLLAVMAEYYGLLPGGEFSDPVIQS